MFRVFECGWHKREAKFDEALKGRPAVGRHQFQSSVFLDWDVGGNLSRCRGLHVSNCTTRLRKCATTGRFVAHSSTVSLLSNAHVNGKIGT